jgi:DNA-3-methyladenine glycosylase I
MKIRCAWASNEPLFHNYHDEIWGVPAHDDRTLFEFLVLSGAQAGLSWLTILRRRDQYQKAFDGFDAERVAKYSERKIRALLVDPGIIRNELKVRCAIGNAKAVVAVQKEFGTFDKYLWDFVQGKPVVNRWKSIKQIPARTPLSDTLSADLGHRGFKFVGSTICYAFMQTIGMVNDHTRDCYRHNR